MIHICTVCGYQHNDDFQIDSFEKLPDDWCCPVCKAEKTSFRGISIDYNEGDG